MKPSLHPIGELQTDAALGLSCRIRQPVPLNPAKCVVILHGVGGNETNLIDIAAGIDPDTLVVFPRGPLQLGAQQFAWFRVMFTATGPNIVAEEAERSREAMIHFVAQLQLRYGITAKNTVIAGFSQGGILSASVALTAPESVAGFALLSGRILPELESRLASKERLARLKGFIGHGEHDSKLPVHWAHRSDKLLSELGVDHLLRLYPMDHGISAGMHADFLKWMASLGSPSSPGRDD
jgi:phospholipase/carboxylesterase